MIYSYTFLNTYNNMSTLEKFHHAKFQTMETTIDFIGNLGHLSNVIAFSSRKNGREWSISDSQQWCQYVWHIYRNWFKVSEGTSFILGGIIRLYTASKRYPSWDRIESITNPSEYWDFIDRSPGYFIPLNPCYFLNFNNGALEKANFFFLFNH